MHNRITRRTRRAFVACSYKQLLQSKSATQQKINRNNKAGNKNKKAPNPSTRSGSEASLLSSNHYQLSNYQLSLPLLPNLHNIGAKLFSLSQTGFIIRAEMNATVKS